MSRHPAALSPLTATVSLLSLIILLLTCRSVLSLSFSLPGSGVPHRLSVPLPRSITHVVHALSDKTVSQAPVNMSELEKKYPSIVKGDRATENIVRHSCIIFLRNVDGNVFRCSGSILSRKKVITAAHCFFSGDLFQFSTTQVYVRPAQLKSGQGAVYVGKFVDILKTYIPQTLQNDVAIITLNGIIRENVKRVKLPMTRERTPRDSIAKTAGYGQVRDSARLANVLRSVDLRLQSVRKCGLRFTRSVRETIKREEVLCAVDPRPSGGSDRSICQGDSGGPIFYEQDNGRLLQIGISSFGEKACGSLGTTSWFTNLKTYSRAVKQLRDGNLSAWDRKLQYEL